MIHPPQREKLLQSLNWKRMQFYEPKAARHYSGLFSKEIIVCLVTSSFSASSSWLSFFLFRNSWIRFSKATSFCYVKQTLLFKNSIVSFTSFVKKKAAKKNWKFKHFSPFIIFIDFLCYLLSKATANSTQAPPWSGLSRVRRPPCKRATCLEKAKPIPWWRLAEFRLWSLW